MTRKGPTLVELIIVFVVLGLMAAVLFPAFAAARERRFASTCAGNLSRIYRALQLYQEDWDDQLPPHNPRNSWTDKDRNTFIVAQWQQYGLTLDTYRCPSSFGQKWNFNDYEFRLSLIMDFDDRWSNPQKFQFLQQHPTWAYPASAENQDMILDPPVMDRTIVPAPESVLAICDAHIRHGNPGPPGTVSGYYQVLRANGKVERIPAAQSLSWGYVNGKWYPPGSQGPGGIRPYQTFPHEPWPPRFKP